MHVTVVGIFVGGAAQRMGGKPKGLLRTGDDEESVIDRTVALAREVSPRVVLVGRSDAYSLELPRVPDRIADAVMEPPAQATSREGAWGPMGGLASLLGYAGAGSAIALACDMPFISAELLHRLAAHEPESVAVAPKRNGQWEPFLARFEVARTLPIVESRLTRRALAMRGLLDELMATELPLFPGESTLLTDWDCPGDMARLPIRGSG
jgi:molybdopterin-guanine dinucleotide biosynthesis protein A